MSTMGCTTLLPGLLASLLLGTPAAAPAPHDPPRGDFVVHCGTLHVGDGRVLHDAWLTVREGAIAGIGEERPEGDLPVLDAGDEVVIPGIVAADSDLSRHGDDRYNVTPDFVAADGFDFLAKRKVPLSGGVTTAYLSPGRERLVTGQGSVVKLHGTDIVERVVAEHACLRVTLGHQGTVAPRLFEPTPFPTSDDPLLPARMQVPTARISMLAVLRDLFRQATAEGDQLVGPTTAAPEDRYRASAFARVKAGELPLRTAAVEAADIRRALVLAGELGARLVLEDPYEIGEVAGEAAQSGAGAVLRVPFTPGQLDPAKDRRDDESPRRDPAAPAAAAAAGMTLALVPENDAGLGDFLTIAAVAIRHGLPAENALRAITLDAARLLGVGDRVGSLEPGKDADFVVLSGAPFAVGTMVEKTYVDGEPAYEHEPDARLLALRCGRILTGTGETLRDATLLVENGRIKALGEEMAVPYGAEVVDLPGAVVVPGFVDAHSHAGIAGRAGGIPAGRADHRIADVVAPGDPMLRPPLEAGITTVLVAGKDGGPVSGRVTALKTGAADREHMVVAEIAGQRFTYDATAPDGIKQLRGIIDKGRKYLEAWKKYEKALADWKAGKGKKPEEEAPDPGEAEVDPISGTWELEVRNAPVPMRITLELELDGETITGTVHAEMRGNRMPPQEITQATFDGRNFEARFPGMGGEAVAKGTVENDAMRGTVTMGPMEFEFTGTRIAKPGGTPAAGAGGEDDGTPTKPNVDENLEPIKAILEKRATAVIHTDRAPAIRAVVDYFSEQGLPFVLYSARDAVEDPGLLDGHGTGVLLPPDFLRREGGRVENAAAALSDRGLPVALVSAAGIGGRDLPVHAAFAVRHGMSPDRALAALTLQPARMFHIDDRVGSLEVGKDADFVVFSGNPFELTSRILLVGVDGRLVVDRRTGEDE